VGSSNSKSFERAFKLISSALKLVTDGSRTPEQLADHLQKFVFEGRNRVLSVDYDSIDYNERLAQYNRSGNPKADSFPIVGKGKSRVEFDYIEFDYGPFTHEIVKDISARQDVRWPDFAEAATFFSENSQELKEKTVVAFCLVKKSRKGFYISYLIGGGRSLVGVYKDITISSGMDSHPDKPWKKDLYFLVVRK